MNQIANIHLADLKKNGTYYTKILIKNRKIMILGKISLLNDKICLYIKRTQ